MRYVVRIAACVGIAGSLHMGASAEEAAESEPAVFEARIHELVEVYCNDCHNPDDLKGDLNLERFETTDMVIDSLAVWQRIAKRLESKEMPPKSKPQPTPEERQEMIDWIASLKFNDEDCDQIASEESVAWYRGDVMSRRLNRWEYENTLRDLLGIEIDAADMFPADGAGGEGFDNHGSALFLSAIQIERYLEVADIAIEEAIPATPYMTKARESGTPYRPRTEAARMSATARDRLITARPSRSTTVQAAATEAIEHFIQRAWRRPVTQEEVDRLLAIFNRSQDRGERYDSSLKLAYKAALISPNFVFLPEPEPEEQGNYLLGDYPLASRLSYLIWGSMPDDELFDLAAQGKLNDDEVLEGQVRRMLADPKAIALGEIFARQWLNIDQLGETKKPDEERFPEFDDDLREAMNQEAVLFFGELIRQDRSLLELIDANYTYANEGLAGLYGIDGVEGDEMRRVELTDPNRGGVTGMAATLTATSHPLRTSPVLRGKWVLEQLLGDHVPPPPPDAGTLPEDDQHPDGLTFREQLELHRQKAECASCHSKMDPIGFGLENFDPIGRWRAEQGGQPVDATGVLPSGEAFSGPQELKALLMKRKDVVARNLSRKLLGYALGRGLTRYDNCVIDDCVEALQQDDYRASALFLEIVMSYPFRYRYGGGLHVEDKA